MKTIKFLTIGCVLTAIFAVPGFSQTATKLALVDTDAFYVTGKGIKKIETAYNALTTEFAPLQNELTSLSNKAAALQKELQTLQEQLKDPANKVPIRRETVQLKVDEFEKLKVDIKRKQEDAKARYEKREAAVLSPVLQAVGKSIGDFAKQKGYSMVMDSGKLVNAQVLLFATDSDDITAAFIAYYNALP